MADQERQTLEQWARAHNTPQRVVFRCRIVLLAAQGLSNAAIAERLSTTRATVGLWRERFVQGAPSALESIKKGRGRKPSIPAEKAAQIAHDTLRAKPEGRPIGAAVRCHPPWDQPGHGAAHLVGARPQAAHGEDVQGSPTTRNSRRS